MLAVVNSLHAAGSMSVDSPTAAKENHPPISQTTPGSKRRAAIGPSPLRRSTQDPDGHSGETPASVRRKTAQRSLAFGKVCLRSL